MNSTMLKVLKYTAPWHRYKVKALIYLKGDYMTDKSCKGYLIAALGTRVSFFSDLIRGIMHISRTVKEFKSLDSLQLVNAYLDISLGIALILSAILVCALTLSVLVNPYFKKPLILWFVIDMIVSLVAKDFTTAILSAIMVLSLYTYPNFERMNYEEKQLYNQTMKFYRHNKHST